MGAQQQEYCLLCSQQESPLARTAQSVQLSSHLLAVSL
jgi:hypothetical protein